MIEIKGCHVSVSVYFAVLIACIIILDHTGLAVFALLCALVHEFGHILVIRLLGIRLEKIDFKIFGINMEIKNGSVIGYREEILISLAGSTFNIILCVLAFFAEKFGFFAYQSRAVLIFSLVIAAFNLLPIGSLDGGRVLEAVLCRHLRFGTAQALVTLVSGVLIVPLFAAGFYLVIRTGYNFALLLAAVYLAAILIFKGRFFGMGKTTGLRNGHFGLKR